MSAPSSRSFLTVSPSRLLPLLALLLVATPAVARRCGDDVGGRRVPCACGDVVVSSVRLDARHPVTQSACAADGLVVDGAPGLVVDLGGSTITGSGRGVGLSFTGHDGAELRGPGTIEGFDSGVVARRDALGQVSDVVARGNRSDGFRIVGSGFAVLRCEATQNGRQGFVLRGDAFHVEGCQATDNGRDGLDVAGAGAVLDAQAGNVASGNHRAAARVRGKDNAVDPALAPPPKARHRHICREGASCR
jgi:hypothetical protein